MIDKNDEDAIISENSEEDEGLAGVDIEEAGGKTYDNSQDVLLSSGRDMSLGEEMFAYEQKRKNRDAKQKGKDADEGQLVQTKFR